MTSFGGAPVARGDRFQKVARDVEGPVFRFVRRRASREIADEVVADTLLVLWRRLDEVAAGGEIAYCLGVARRSLANRLRSDRRQNRLIGRLSSSFTRGHPPTAADLDTSENTALHEALDHLTRGDRELLTMWAWDGLEAREIGAVLDITPNAASIRLHRAKDRLREHLERKNQLPTGQSSNEGTETR